MRCGVLGDPIEHSLSPVLHRAGYAALGLDWTYDAHRVAAGGLAAFLDGLDGSWRGLSLTMPLKREAMALVDEVERARRCSAALPTRWCSARGGVRGDNTDMPGAPRPRCASGTPARSTGRRSSAAARRRRPRCWRWPSWAVAPSPCSCATPARAAETLAAAEPLGERFARRAGRVDVPGGRAGGRRAGLHDPGARRRIPALVGPLRRRRRSVFEVLYHPWPTPLAAAAVGAARVLVGGLDLLVHQAALQFELFTGVARAAGAMRQAGLAALRERLDEGPEAWTQATLAAAAVAVVLCGAAGLLVPWLIGRLPEPEPEPSPTGEPRPDEEPEGALRRHRGAAAAGAGGCGLVGGLRRSRRPGHGVDVGLAGGGARGAASSSLSRWSTCAPGCCRRC